MKIPGESLLSYLWAKREEFKLRYGYKPTHVHIPYAVECEIVAYTARVNTRAAANPRGPRFEPINTTMANIRETHHSILLMKPIWGAAELKVA